MFALGGAKASRLDQALVYKTQTAQSVTCDADAQKLTGVAVLRHHRQARREA